MKKRILTTLFVAGLLTSALYADSNGTSEHNMMSKDECFAMCKTSSPTNDTFKKDAIFEKVLENVTNKDPYSG